MTQLDETSTRLLELLRTYARWQQPNDDSVLTDGDRDLVRQLAEERLLPGTSAHDKAIQLVAQSREARQLWTTFIQMESDLEDGVLESMQQSLMDFLELRNEPSASATPAPEPAGQATYSAQVIDLVARLRRKSPGLPNTGFTIERYAAETLFASAGRGKYVTEDMVMSLVFPSMDPQAEPIGFLITCPIEIVRRKYAGKQFHVLFVEPESHASGTLEHCVRVVGPFDSSGEIEERFAADSRFDRCIVPVWIDVLGD